MSTLKQSFEGRLPLYLAIKSAVRIAGAQRSIRCSSPLMCSHVLISRNLAALGRPHKIATSKVSLNRGIRESAESRAKGPQTRTSGLGNHEIAPPTDAQESTRLTQKSTYFLNADEEVASAKSLCLLGGSNLFRV